MKRVLKFLFNLLRNLSFIFCLLLAGFAIWSYADPQGAEHLIENIEASAAPQDEVISYEVILPQSAENNLSPRSSEQRHIVLKIGQQQLFFALDEFVFAKRISDREKYLRIHLQDKSSHELRISIVALQRKLNEFGLKTYQQQSHLINPFKIRGIAPGLYKDSWQIELKPPFSDSLINLPSKNRVDRVKDLENLIQRSYQEYQIGQYPGENGQ